MLGYNYGMLFYRLVCYSWESVSNICALSGSVISTIRSEIWASCSNSFEIGCHVNQTGFSGCLKFIQLLFVFGDWLSHLKVVLLGEFGFEVSVSF